MSSAVYYRKEAARCRELAAQSPLADMANRWRALAADYDMLADALDSSGVMAPARAPMQQQPMQQQQSKSEPDK
jgi:hypothetical protein